MEDIHLEHFYLVRDKQKETPNWDIINLLKHEDNNLLFFSNNADHNFCNLLTMKFYRLYVEFLK